MIIPHPPIITSSTSQTIQSIHGNISACFIALHPFILTKPGHEQLISFEDYFNRPQKSDILEHTRPITWTEFILLAGLRDISSLARCIIFLERGRRLVERNEYLKMCAILDTRADIMTPPVDWIPEQWENDLGNFLLSKNQPHLEVDYPGKGMQTIETKRLLGEQSVLPGSFSPINTPDGALKLYQSADEPYTIIFGEQHFLVELIERINLEGFFANEQTRIGWNDVDIPPKDQMDWEEDMRRLKE